LKLTQKRREEVCTELGKILSIGEATKIKNNLNLAAINYGKKDERLGEFFKKQKVLLFGD